MTKVFAEKRCSKCGAAFPCGATSGTACWCAERPPVAAIDPGIDCLCPSCLKTPSLEMPGPS